MLQAGVHNSPDEEKLKLRGLLFTEPKQCLINTHDSVSQSLNSSYSSFTSHVMFILSCVSQHYHTLATHSGISCF